jgi:hypothetical protein
MILALDSNEPALRRAGDIDTALPLTLPTITHQCSILQSSSKNIENNGLECIPVSRWRIVAFS